MGLSGSTPDECYGLGASPAVWAEATEKYRLLAFIVYLAAVAKSLCGCSIFINYSIKLNQQETIQTTNYNGTSRF